MCTRPTPSHARTQTANLDELKRQLEAARAESERIRAHYEKKLAKERYAKSESEKTCERLAKQNAELQRRLRTLTAPLPPIDDPTPAATADTDAEKGAKKTRGAAPSPLPPLPQVPAVPATAVPVALAAVNRRGHSRSVSDTKPLSGGRAKGSAALSQFIP